MRRYVATRLILAVPMLGFVASLGFVLIHAAPGDPVVALGGEFADAGVQAELRERFGLDRSVPEQYFVYLRRLLHADLGTSFYFQRPVVDVITGRLPATMGLVLPALALSSVFGVALGVSLASRKGAGRARGAIALVAASNAVPVFWLAQIVLLIFAVQLGWFPVQGMSSPRGGAGIVDALRHLALPLFTLTFHQVAFLTVLTWAGVRRELKSEYVRAAAGRGLHPRAVVGHAFVNALPPIVTTVGGRVAALISGAVLTETVFAWPGLGRLSVLASTHRDYPLVLGLFLFISLLVVVANLVTDVVYAWIDPRIRYS